MTTSSPTPTDIISQLVRDEGKRYSYYRDSLGYASIGVGTCIDAARGCGLTDQEIDLLLRNRVTIAKNLIDETWPWMSGLSPARLGVIINMTYQMGIGGVSAFHDMLRSLQAGDYQAASEALLDSLWAKEQSPARASRLAQQLLTDTWQ